MAKGQKIVSDRTQGSIGWWRRLASNRHHGSTSLPVKVRARRLDGQCARGSVYRIRPELGRLPRLCPNVGTPVTTSPRAAGRQPRVFRECRPMTAADWSWLGPNVRTNLPIDTRRRSQLLVCARFPCITSVKRHPRPPSPAVIDSSPPMRDHKNSTQRRIFEHRNLAKASTSCAVDLSQGLSRLVHRFESGLELHKIKGLG